MAEPELVYQIKFHGPTLRRPPCKFCRKVEMPKLYEGECRMPQCPVCGLIQCMTEADWQASQPVVGE